MENQIKSNGNQDLIHRLNRIQGQIEALKRIVQSPDTDCTKTMQLLKAVSNALKKFGEAYVSNQLRICIQNKGDLRELEENLKNVINSSFYL